MGCYVYTIRATNPARVRLPSGELITAYRKEYLYKPYSSWYGSTSRWMRAMNMHEVRAENVWQRRGGLPEYVVDSFEGEPQAGFSLMRWTHRSPVWNDCGSAPGETLAYLTRRTPAGIWECEPVEVARGRYEERRALLLEIDDMHERRAQAQAWNMGTPLRDSEISTHVAA